MSNAIKIGKGEKDNKPKPKISQSIPAHFYKNYIPPKTPSIKPMAPPQIPDFEALPKISPSGKGINLQQGGSFSLQRNKHPMSMPAKGALFGPSGKTPFEVKGFNPVAHKDDEIKEEPEESNSLEQQTKKLKVGSFTCFEVMNSPLRQLPESVDNIKDNASAASASTFDDKANKPPSDEEPEEEEEDDEDAEAGGFDMEL
mmetsp:Transcript_40832/g.65602  ORF Transcript_40832/g.65602 Transcript_40832/m.65602 type:complete len:200 (-) Transcript_40832:1273-1872(-)|eukprot:CAMPEP_0197028746 /NCGR_PEP_ID=MMETSP1384-20130603/8356_1 /TAXON_ID=29189 /ORGANISM="Ammonia sp." /LENGTH=199 /DNA_ID=CAMNT_0042457791 /DNA_START=154 /DNA_END=753 /DNA_ORIENTATION=+